MRALALAAALAAAAPAGRAAELHVSAAHGDDAAAGSARAPWRTLARAAKALRPGDRLVIEAGRYGDGLQLSASGLPGRPIRVVGEGRPLIEAPADAVFISGSYVEVEGLEAHSTGAGSAVFIGKRNHHVRVAHVIARDSGCAGIGAVETDYLTIEDNRVYGNARRTPWQCSGVSLYQAVAADALAGFHNVIRGNVVYDNMNAVVDEAVSHSGGHTTDGNGIIVDDFDHTQPGSTAEPYRAATLVQGNTTFDNGGRGVHVFHSRGVVVVGNVAYHDLKDRRLNGPAAELSAVFAGDTFWLDNIADAGPGGTGLMNAYAEGPNRFDYDVVSADRPMLADHAPSTWGAHLRLMPDPGFVRPSTRFGADFHLRPDSEARGAGVAVRLGGPGLVCILAGRAIDPGL